MKIYSVFLSVILLLSILSGCSAPAEHAQIAATTLPVHTFTAHLCEGTGISVTQLVTESVSCLHDYSLNAGQVRSAEAAELVVVSGAGLEDFLDDLLLNKEVIDSSQGIPLLECDSDHAHGEHSHSHEADSHIWLSPANAKKMSKNICAGLTAHYPQHEVIFEENLAALLSELDALEAYAHTQLSELACRELITFHDGFGYLADAFGLHILDAVEEESGSEASAAELIALIHIVRAHSLPAVFTEINGSSSAAQIIARETGAQLYALDMTMSGSSWFDAMYYNIDTLKEALG